MKIIASIILCFFFECSIAQPKDCARFKNGSFKLVNAGKTTLIKRTGSLQVESYNNVAIPTTYSVKWLDNCTYTLTPTAATLKRNPGMPRNTVLKVMITKTTRNSYFQVSMLNYSGQKFSGEIVKLD